MNGSSAGTNNAQIGHKLSSNFWPSTPVSTPACVCLYSAACMRVRARVHACFDGLRGVVATAETSGIPRACAQVRPSRVRPRAGVHVRACTCVSTSAGVSPRALPREALPRGSGVCLCLPASRRLSRLVCVPRGVSRAVIVQPRQFRGLERHTRASRETLACASGVRFAPSSLVCLVACAAGVSGACLS